MNFTLSLTHDCNLDCVYCYAGGKSKRVMSWDVARRGVDFAFSFGAKEAQLGFFGGEPLLEWDLLRRATGYAEDVAVKNGVTLKKTVTTNATLLSAERLAWLKGHDFYLALSIDGDKAMHDLTRPLRGGESSFDQCMRGLDLALPVFPDLEVIVVPDPANVRHLAESVRFLCEEKCVRRVGINPNFYTDWPDETLNLWACEFEAIGDFYLERYRAGKPVWINFIDGKIITRLKGGYEHCDKCGFGEREVAVAPSGNLYPCERLVGEDDDTAVRIGDVFAGFDEGKRQALLQRRGNVNAECVACALKKRCMNWCGCINYATTGAIDTIDGVVCFHERLAIRVADRVGGMLYREASPPFLARFYHEDFSDLPEVQ